MRKAPILFLQSNNDFINNFDVLLLFFFDLKSITFSITKVMLITKSFSRLVYDTLSCKLNSLSLINNKRIYHVLFKLSSFYVSIKI